jgi:hypothetical protein
MVNILRGLMRLIESASLSWLEFGVEWSQELTTLRIGSGSFVGRVFVLLKFCGSFGHFLILIFWFPATVGSGNAVVA